MIHGKISREDIKSPSWAYNGLMGYEYIDIWFKRILSDFILFIRYIFYGDVSSVIILSYQAISEPGKTENLLDSLRRVRQRNVKS